jgi:hypothetical protein
MSGVGGGRRFAALPKSERDYITMLEAERAGPWSNLPQWVGAKLAPFRAELLDAPSPARRRGTMSPRDHAASVLSFMAHELLTGSIFRRLREDDVAAQVWGLRVSARFEFLSDIVQSPDYASGNDCLHVFDLLTALAAGDERLVRAYLARFPGPAKEGHQYTILICNAVTVLARRDTAAYPDLADALARRNGSQYEKALMAGLASIMRGEAQATRQALLDLLRAHRRHDDNRYGGRRYLSVAAHGLVNLARVAGTGAVGGWEVPPAELTAWDEPFQAAVAADSTEPDLTGIAAGSPHLAECLAGLPARLTDEELRQF